MTNNGHMYKILIVDDDPGNINFLRLALRDDYLVLIAEDGLAGMDILKRPENIDIALILTDERMPKISGTELLKESLDTHPNTIRWLITAYPEKKDSIYDKKAIQVDRYIRKPIQDRIDELKDDVRAAIKLFELRRQNRYLLKEIAQINENYDRLRSELKKFLPEFRSRKLRKNDLELLEKIEEKDVTVLYANMRNFVDLCSRLNYKDLFIRLNQYLNEMSGVIVKHNGAIIQYTREAILAAFGLNEPSKSSPEEDARDALRCALEMKEALEGFNKNLKSDNIPDIHFGVGISSGQVGVGSVGSDYLINLTVIGKVVSTAIWMQNEVRETQNPIIIGEETHNRAKNILKIKCTKHLMERECGDKSEIIRAYLVDSLESKN